MTSEEIQALPDAYARAAAMAKNVGFGGVQIHAGHGFLFSQFLSPLFNLRTDKYGGIVANRFRIINETIEAVRQAVGASFPIGIKMNSTDKLVGGLTGDDALEVVRMLDATSIDLIDVSGGTYFPGAKASSDGAPEAGPYFIDFARRAKSITSIPIMLTGGIRTRKEASDAIKTNAADAVGLARSMVLEPSLANLWLIAVSHDPLFPIFEAPPRGGITAWYSMRITALAENTKDRFSADLVKALKAYDERDAERCVRWLQRFG